MVNMDKIITMTKLALYDKHQGFADRAANEYFRHDYIYRKNLGNRLAVGFGGLIILIIYWLRVIFLDGVDVFQLNLQLHIRDSIVFILALMAVYTVIGTIQGTREYYNVQKRLDKYRENMSILEKLDGRTPVPEAHEEKPRRSRPQPAPVQSAPAVTDAASGPGRHLGRLTRTMPTNAAPLIRRTKKD